MAIKVGKLPRGLDYRGRVSKDGADVLEPTLLNFRAGSHKRESVATLWDEYLLRRFGLNELRERSHGWFVFEPPRTNRMKWSNDWTKTEAQPGWSNGSPVNVPIVLGPDGNDAAKVMALASGGGTPIYIWPDGYWPATPTPCCCTGFFMYPENFARTRFATRTQSGSSTGIVDDTYEAAPGEWRRYFLPIDDMGGAGFASYWRSYPSNDPIAFPGFYAVYGAQMEEGATPSSLIETTDTEETREGDELLIDAADIPDAFLNGPWSVRLQMKGSSYDFVADGSSQLFLFDGSNHLVLSKVHTNYVHVQMVVGGSYSQVSSFSWDTGDEIELRCNPLTGELKAISSLTTATSSIGGGGGWPPGVDLSIGWRPSTGNLHLHADITEPVAIDAV